VLETGVKNFVGKLADKDIRAALKALGMEETDKKKEGKTLETALLTSGINGLLNKAEDKLLTTFCETLGLGNSERTAMIKEIADEVMLTGMESFLNQMSSAILKPHCSELKLALNGTKKEMVERLMVHIFELEPLDEGEEDKGKKGGKKATNKATKKERSKSPKKETEKKEEKKKKEPREKSPKKPKEPKPKAEPKKKEKFVAPPLDTIGSKYKTYVDLYDNFNLPDLTGYCKNNSLKSGGAKKEVIKRILAHLSGEPEKTKAPKKRKATGAPTKKKTTKKAKTDKKEGEAKEAESK